MDEERHAGADVGAWHDRCSGLSSGPPYETRAIDILAPAEQAFAWVAQLGQNRAGFYSYTALENLVGCEMPDVRQLDPALQEWTPDDKLWMYPPDELDAWGTRRCCSTSRGER